MKRKWRRTLSVLLSIAMLFSMTGMNTVFATEGGQTVGESGLCEHHPAHTADCGYTDGAPGTPCGHEHMDDCYKEVTECIHEHRSDCYPASDSISDNDATPSDAEQREPTECTHMCSEESGCITEELDCQHEHKVNGGEADREGGLDRGENCGYTPAVPGTPCAFVCGECAKDSGEQNPPPAKDELVQIITGFAGVDGSAPLDTIEVTEKTTVAAIGLPGTLAVTLDGADGEAAIPVTWECADDYENTEYETYDFTPVPGEGYALAEGLGKNDLPYITVNIVTAANKNLRTAVTVTGILKFGGTIVVHDLTQDGSDTTGGSVAWAWDAAAATLTLTGNGSIGGSSNDIVFLAVGDVTVEVNGTVSASALTYKEGHAGSLTLTGSGVLTLSNEGKNAIWAREGLEISGLTVNASTTGEYSSAISVDLGSFTMTGGKLIATATGNTTNGIYASQGINISDTAEVTASAGNYGLTSSRDINISGGTVEAASTEGRAGIRTGDGVLNISGGSVTAKSAGGELAIDALGGVTVGSATLITGENGNGGGIRENLTVNHTDADVTVNGHILRTYNPGTEGNLTVSAGTAEITGDVSGNVTVSGGAVTVGGTVNGLTNHTGGTLNGKTPPTHQITFTAEQTGGVSGTTDSTGIVLTFSQEVTGLTKSAIKCSTREGNAVIDGEPAGSGKVWTIPILVDTEGSVDVSIDQFGDFNVTNNPQLVMVYKASGGGSATHTINFGYSSGGTLTATVDGVAISNGAAVQQGKNIVFTAAPDAFYRVKEWKDNGVTVNGTNETYTLSDIVEPHTIYVAFEKIPVFAVTVNSGTGGGSYAEGATVTITADAAPTGQRFKEWTVNSGDVTLANPQVQSTSFTMPASAVEVTATYEALPAATYSITVQDDGHGTASANVNSAQQGTAITLTATANSGYRFKEWQVIEGGVTIANNSFTMPAVNVTVKAIFEEIPVTKYALTVTNGGGSGTYEAGSTVTITAEAPAQGKVFDKWIITSGGGTLADASSATTTYTMPAGPATVTATYQDAPATVTTVTVTPGNPNVQKGATQQFMASVIGTNNPAQTVTWTVTGRKAGTSISNTGLLTVAADETAATLTVGATSTADTSKSGTATVTVTSAPVSTYALTVTNGSGSGSYEEGATVTITANAPAAGQQFKDWTISPSVVFTNGTSRNSATANFTMPDEAVTATATYEALPTATYSITVQDDGNGTAGANVNSARQGARITLTASASSGYRFKEWQVVSGGVNIANNSFTMPAANVTVKAIFERIPAVSISSATVSGVNASYTQTGSAIKPVPVVTLNGATLREHIDYTVSYSNNVSVGTATITITGIGNYTGTKTVTFTIQSSGGDGGGGGSSSGGGTTAVTPPDPGKPDTATNAETKVTPTVTTEGSATVTVPDKSVTDAIKAAQDAVKKAGTEKNGVSVTIDATTGKEASDITATLTGQSVDALIKAGVTEVRIKADAATITLDLATLKTAQAVAGGAVIVSAKPVAASTLSAAAQNAIGNRPVFGLALTSGGKAVTSFGGGSVSVAIPYTLPANEKTGNVQAVYVDGSGKVTWLTNSSYDVNAKALLFSTGHFSVFGVGYKADAPVFTDTDNHWAKADIEFVAARGLLSGTDSNQFSPDTSITRGMFVTALGRLAGVDTNSYKAGKFADVKADAYYAAYVNWAAEKGIVNGTTATTFAPNKSVTRQEMAVIIADYAKALGYTVPKTREAMTFADNANIASWAKDAAKAMQMAGIINTRDGNRFDPQGTATRAEVAAVLHRYVELVIDPATAQGWTQNDAGQWLYYENGKPVIGWNQVDVKWYYLDSAGLMQSGGWKQIGGKWYYLYADGSMAVSTKIDGYEVGPDGVLKES